MWFRVNRDFEWTDQKSVTSVVKSGELVDILNKHDAKMLLTSGLICAKEHSAVSETNAGPAAAQFTKTLRVGIWLLHTPHYSGGRVHVYQYANCLAQAGAEIFYITNGVARPLWEEDYPICGNIHFLNEKNDPIPNDLDIVMTDSKGNIGLRASAWTLEHPHVRFVCLNFETANWVKKFVPEIAANMNITHLRQGYAHAHILLGNSEMSTKYLKEWMGKGNQRYGTLCPAVNTHALEQDGSSKALPKNPYVVFSARGTKYKCGDLVMQAIWELDIPFDLVTFGDPGCKIQRSSLHNWISLKNFNDAVKFHFMRNAHMVLAPSLFEGFGMVPGESLASGTPCIVYDLPVLRENYGNRLVYVKWNDANGFKRKIKELANLPKLNVGKEKEWVIEKFGLKAMAKCIEDIPYHTLKRKKVSVMCICYSTPTVQEAIKSVYPYVDQIIVAYGPTQMWKDWPEGGVLERLKKMRDPDKKIQIEARSMWKDKLEMRRWCTEQVEGNYLLFLDADEIWEGLDKWLASDETDFASPRWIHLWHGLNHWIHSGRWGNRFDYGTAQGHYRFSWWRPSYQWTRHEKPVDFAGKNLGSVENNRKVSEIVSDCAIYHLGHAMPKPYMKRKHDFYSARDGASDSRTKAWHDWKGKLGDCGDGTISKVDWKIPELVKKAYKKILKAGKANG